MLPELEREVNEGENFATVRQVYSGMLLAAWYKRALKESLLSKIYADKARVKGVDQDPKNNEQIYRQYLRAYKKGVFNYIKEDIDKYTNETIPRKYFSGGFEAYGKKNEILHGNIPIAHELTTGQSKAMLAEVEGHQDDLAMFTVAEKNVAREEAPAVNPVNKQLEEYLSNLKNSDDSRVFNETAIARIIADIPQIMELKLRGEQEQSIQNLLGRPDLPPVTNAQVRAIVQKILGKNDAAMTTAAAMNIPVEEYAKDFLAKNPVFHTIFGSSEQDAKIKLVNEFKAWASKPQEGTGKPVVLPKGDGFLASLFSLSKQIGSQIGPQIGSKREESRFLYRVEPADHAMFTDAARGIKQKSQEAYLNVILGTAGVIFPSAFLAVVSLTSDPNPWDWKLTSAAVGTIAVSTGYLGIYGKKWMDIKKLEKTTSAFRTDIEGDKSTSDLQKSLRELVDAFKKVQSYERIAKAEAKTEARFYINSVLGEDRVVKFSPVVMEALKEAYDSAMAGQPENMTSDMQKYINDRELVPELIGLQFEKMSMSDGQKYAFIDAVASVKKRLLEEQDMSYGQVSNYLSTEYDKLKGVQNLNDADRWKEAAQNLLSQYPKGQGLQPTKDLAMKGGIDFNAANLNLQIKRDGNGVPLPISQQDLENINIDGLVPIIIEIKPATSLPIFSELQPVN